MKREACLGCDGESDPWWEGTLGGRIFYVTLTAEAERFLISLFQSTAVWTDTVKAVQVALQETRVTHLRKPVAENQRTNDPTNNLCGTKAREAEEDVDRTCCVLLAV